MAFQTKNRNAIVASMVNITRMVSQVLTDFVIGSRIRTIYYAVALEIEQLYTQAFIGITEGIAAGIFRAFQFPALPATLSTGFVTFTADIAPVSNIPIPVGTLVAVPGTQLNYATTVASVLLAGHTTVIVPVASLIAGSSQNTPLDTIQEIVNPISGISSVNNANNFTTGKDAETVQDRLIRFSQFIASLSRGTVAAILYGSSLANVTDAAGYIIEQVVDAYFYEPFMTNHAAPTTVSDLYIYNGVGVASDALIAACQNIIDGYFDEKGNLIAGYKCAGTTVNVQSVSIPTISPIILVIPKPGFLVANLVSAIQQVIGQYVSALGVGAEFIYNEFVTIIMGVPGVDDIVSITPTANIATAPSQKYLLNTLTIQQFVSKTLGDISTSVNPNEIKNVDSVVGLANGMFIYGNGIPVGTTILSITGHTITMTQNATATAIQESVTFGVTP